MPTFTYKALNKKGKQVKGSIEAGSNTQALEKLRETDLLPTYVAEDKKGKKRRGAKPAGGGGGLQMEIKIPFLTGGVKTKDLTVFTRQLATLIEAGLPLVRSLNILRDQAKPGSLKTSLGKLATEVEGGSTFSEALGRQPKIFSKLFVNMVKAGEAGGMLEVVLKRLAEFAEKAQRLAQQIKSDMYYPIAVMSFAILVLFGLIRFIVPKFMEIFRDVGTDLPPLTQGLMAVSDFLQTRLFLVSAVVGIPAIVIFFKILTKNSKTKYLLDAIKLKMPVFGMLAQKVSIAQFSRTLGTLIASGVPILQALSITRDTSGNEIIARAIGKVHDSIREGESIAGPLGESRAFPLMVVNMVDVGEETGNLDQMLVKIADTYDEEVDAAVAGLTSLLEPMLIVGMGLMVGIIVIAMFLPLITLITALGGA